MRRSRFWWLVGCVVGLLLVAIVLSRRGTRDVSAGLETPPAAAPAPDSAARGVPADERMSERSTLLDGLNSPTGSIQQDVQLVAALFEHWQSNFPREGNPVGTNAEITAALAGANRLELALVPRDHPAINADGELCDRWGTPFRFHQLSGTEMQIISAGPDRDFATGDDVVAPEPTSPQPASFPPEQP